MKKRYKNNKIQNTSLRLSIFVGLFFLSFILLIYLVVIKTQKRSVVESPKTEMKTIPHGMNKTIAQEKKEKIMVPILMYHYIENVKDERDTIRKSLNITPETFEEQLKTLKNGGYTFMTAKQLGEVIDHKRDLPEKPVVLTFDDGHKDVYQTVLPLLVKYQATGTIYVITDFLGGSDFMTKEELNAVISGGVIEVGAHTMHHVSLKNVLKKVAVDEIAGSKKWLENQYHIQVVSFAYPNGAFDEQAAQEVQNAGYTNAVSTIPGTEVSEFNRFFLYRLRPGYRTGQVLLDYLTSETQATPESKTN